ncbi:hypothetical protein OAJ27_00330 [bacterium]|nr:hypothetical protein [bacterium]
MTHEEQLFLKEFEIGALPFHEWTHKSHLHMGWLYLTNHDVVTATEKIHAGIINYNSLHKENLQTGYCKKTTTRWITLILAKINQTKDISFSLFIERNKDLLNKNPLLPAPNNT